MLFASRLPPLFSLHYFRRRYYAEMPIAAFRCQRQPAPPERYDYAAAIRRPLYATLFAISILRHMRHAADAIFFCRYAADG
jgi:hypothetical protein